MAVTVGTGLVSVERQWPEFERTLDGTEKALKLQYEEDASKYALFAIDGVIVYQATIFKAGQEPSSWTQQQKDDNATYRTDFTTNWQSTANAPDESPAVSVKHFNGTATTTPATVVFGGMSRSILVHNVGPSSASDLLVSFDSGTTFKTLRRLSAVQINAGLGGVDVKSSTGTVGYEIVVTL